MKGGGDQGKIKKTAMRANLPASGGGEPYGDKKLEGGTNLEFVE